MRRATFSITRLFLAILVCGGASVASAREPSSDGVWDMVDRSEIELRKNADLRPWIQPSRYRAARLSAEPLATILGEAPMEFSQEADSRQVVLSLPTPDGKFETFAIVESPVIAPKLEAWMDQHGWPMRTYRGISLDHPSTGVRLDWGGPAGFHASVDSPGRSYFIDPFWKGDVELYSSYFRSEYVDKERDFRCFVKSVPGHAFNPKSGASTGGNLRTYRLVVAATGEYTAFQGGTKQDAQAAIVTTVNRVNQIYERDLSIRMVLVGNNVDVVFEDGDTDPYTNDDGSAMLGENQTEVDTTIEDANYDIGHVVSTGGGGIAFVGVPCRTGVKARGVTGSSNPVGDPFDIDYVAHEMGHQWGGNHTFNSETGSCGGGNRNASTAYEPGSGSTIQAYAGICGADNLQSNSDAYFHGVSLDEMLDYAAGSGACSTNSPAGNSYAPTVDAGSAYTIPIGTPFELAVASSDDLDGDTLTYTWEQWDLGPAAALSDGDNGASPIFRSWAPSTDMFRTFPKDPLMPAPGETLPTTDRTMTFRLTVRDNNPGGGRLGEDSTTVTSTTSAGPFQVTAPNGGEQWDGTETITWNPAGTTAGSVNAANVDILLSADGGATWPIILVSGTPNDGSQSVTLPDVDTTAALVKIMGSGNIFFDISDDFFSIGTVTTQTLYDQSTSCAGEAWTSQYFPDFADGIDLADDFTVPPGEQWTLGTVSAPGVFSGASNPLQSANVYVWSDSTGLPDSIVSGCAFLEMTPVGGLADPNFEIALPTTCNLNPGTYWIEVQAVMSYTPDSSLWHWAPSTGSVGAEYAVRDPSDLLGSGCTIWTPQGGCLGATEHDLCFSLEGSVGGDMIFADGFESGNTLEWSSAVP